METMGCCATKLTVDSLPPEVLLTVFHNLDLDDILSVRQVCRKWRDWIDFEIPFRVIVDDNHVENGAFVKRVVKEGLHVISLMDVGESSILNCPRRPKLLRNMTVQGPIHPDTLMQVVPSFGNLEELIIGGACLSHELNIPVCTLGNLKILELYSNFQTNGSDDDSFSEFVIPVAKNTMTFLKNIHCPKLRCLMIDGDVDQIKVPDEYDWKGDTLMAFIERYSESLKKILLGESCILPAFPSTAPVRHQHFPILLRSLHFSFYGSQFDFTKKDIMWYDFIGKQRQLELLNIGALWYSHTHEMMQLLPDTIRHLSVYWNIDYSRFFNCEVFARLINLERLELTFDGEFNQIFTNLLSLRVCKNLKVIVLEQGGVIAEDLEEFGTTFPNLEVLYLYRCASGIDESEQIDPLCGITLVALQNIFAMRKLDYLFCTSVDFLGDTDTVNMMMNELEPFVDLNHPSSSYRAFSIGTEPAIPDNISLD